MASYLLDTNVSLWFLDSTDAAHSIAAQAVAALISRAHHPVLAPQILIVLWAMATRPPLSNGWGWNPVRVQTGIEDLMARFTLLEDTGEIFQQWLHLVNVCGVQGKQVHDARLAAVLLSHGHQHIVNLTPPTSGDILASPPFTLRH